jgi:hypothetical protein
MDHELRLAGLIVDQSTALPWLRGVNLKSLWTKLAWLNLTEAAREASALKAQFRREDEELNRQERGAEVWAERKRLLGGTESDRAEVTTVNGVRIDKKTHSTTRLLTTDGVRFRA